MASRSDNFDRADSASALGTPSDGGSAWVAYAGTWGISSNLGYKVSANNNFQAAALECSSSAGDVEVTVTNVSNQGVVGRLVDASNFILGQIASSNFLACYKRVAGTFTQIGSTYSGTTSDFDVIRLSIDSSNNIVLSQNGVSRVTGTDSTHSTATKWGMMVYSTSSLMDNWSFTDDGGGGGPTTYYQNVYGTLTAAGSLRKRTSKHPAGSLTVSGGLATKSVLAMLLTGSMTLSGAVRKLTKKATAGGITASGTLLKKTSRLLQGSLQATGQLTRKALKKVSGSITSVGALATRAVISKAASGVLALSGALSAFKFTPIIEAISSSLTHLRRFCGRR